MWSNSVRTTRRLSSSSNISKWVAFSRWRHTRTTLRSSTSKKSRTWLLFFSIIYIWNSVRSWHLVVHAFRIAQNVQNSSLWETSDKIIENRILIKKKKQSQTSKSVEAISYLSQTCNRYNVKFECHFNCRYRHACFICEIENHFSSQCSSDREQMWDRENSSQEKRDKKINAISRKRLWLAMLDSLRWIFESFLYTLIDEMLLRDFNSLKKND
jgi:hypothetical protein